MEDGTVQAQDLHAENHSTGFCAIEEEEEVLGVDGSEIWLDHNDHQEDLCDVNDAASIFYTGFPPLPDFPCMSSSSSSSSSSTPAPVKAITSSTSSSSASSSSSAASWAVLKSDPEEDHHVDKKHSNNPVDAPPVEALSSTASMEIPQLPEQDGIDCMDMMETFGYMELLEGNDFLDTSSIFENESPFDDFQQNQNQRQQEHDTMYDENPHQEHGHQVVAQSNNVEEICEAKEADDMATVFLEWLRSNRETVSAEDLRSVKIKKATIECAARRLGGGKEAMKQLLKLVLEWVQTNHLQRRRTKDATTLPFQYQDPFLNTSPNPNPEPNMMNSNSLTHESNTCFNQAPWISHSPYDPPATVMVSPPQVYPSPNMGGYMTADPFVNGSGHPYPTPEYHMLDSTPTWPASQFSMASHYTSFPDNNLQPVAPPSHPQAFAGYGNQYPYQYFNGHGGERLARLGSSATKEARKKRMARQRRLLSHHRHHHHHNSTQQSQNHADQQHARLGNSENCTIAAAVQANNPVGNWVYWPAAGSAQSASPAVIQGIPAEPPALRQVDRLAAQAQNYHQGRSDHRRQGWKPEKNLKFLLQKVLKQSDVGSLGRIVLPKKEAETHLPELEARDGISIAMEDIGTSRVWNMRYRYWPNNKSRMYLLENTGDFVRANGLQEGDFIVIYSDVKYDTRSEGKATGSKIREQKARKVAEKPACKQSRWA
ncbi:hypothetical protein FNV43_RR23118 [Rhamnella rubrinervis]|uniref:TF-B3 domain-containing protein n=1 Tax=Rhamnella rubrinervis TaxID=2594499 RepID=A0A8K0DSR5_9ROSA|nr:hypothetical protein FNV43_RR23118 [Rhamnella rubrinervis]